MEKEFLSKRTRRYKLTFFELQALYLFFRDYPWSDLRKNQPVLYLYLLKSGENLFHRIQRTCNQILPNKNPGKRFKLSVSELEIVTLALLINYPHESPLINAVVYRILPATPEKLFKSLKSKFK